MLKALVYVRDFSFAKPTGKFALFQLGEQKMVRVEFEGWGHLELLERFVREIKAAGIRPKTLRQYDRDCCSPYSQQFIEKDLYYPDSEASEDLVLTCLGGGMIQILPESRVIIEGASSNIGAEKEREETALLIQEIFPFHDIETRDLYKK